MVKHIAVPRPGAPIAARSGKKNLSQPPSSQSQSFYHQSLFLSLALDMTWQLAVVVIVPIVGAYLLDHHFQTTPWLTLAGFIVAGAGVVVVLSRIVKVAGARSNMSRHGEKT